MPVGHGADDGLQKGSGVLEGQGNHADLTEIQGVGRLQNWISGRNQ